MSLVDDNGFTTQIDVGLLGAVIFEIITGVKCEIDLFKDDARFDGRAYWPERTSLPSTDDLWLGTIVERCWDGTFRSADSLFHALESQSITPSSVESSIFSLIYNKIRPRFIVTFVGAVGMVAFVLSKPWKLYRSIK
ncbi:hypothetical protein PDIDSM_1609 [Penicillium digitatum]|nr:hypothetical protein PDIDSM_1609 [Penicillium digitatum]